MHDAGREIFGEIINDIVPLIQIALDNYILRIIEKPHPE